MTGRELIALIKEKNLEDFEIDYCGQYDGRDNQIKFELEAERVGVDQRFKDLVIDTNTGETKIYDWIAESWYEDEEE